MLYKVDRLNRCPHKACCIRSPRDHMFREKMRYTANFIAGPLGARIHFATTTHPRSTLCPHPLPTNCWPSN